MNITKEQIDALNAVITVAIEKEDYTDRVEKVLTNYKKTANIPGFRKGQVLWKSSSSNRMCQWWLMQVSERPLMPPKQWSSEPMPYW